MQKRKKRTQKEKLRQACPFALERMISGETVTLQDCADFLEDKTTNSVGTMFGRGTGGNGGANAWVFEGEILPCQENVSLLGAFVSSVEFEKLLERTGMTEEAFKEKVDGLPVADSLTQF